MTGTLQPVPRGLLQRVTIALVAGVVSFAVTSILGVLREGYDPWHQAVSALSLGPGGWIQVINLTVFGLIVLTTVPAWRRILAGGRGETAYPVLTALVGLSFVGVGLIRQDPAPGYDPDNLALSSPTALGLTHLALAGVAALSSVAGLVVMSMRLARSPAWPRWTAYSILTATVVVVCVTIYGVWSVHPSGLAGTFERVAMLAPMLWMYAFLRRLDDGAPFMMPRS